MNVEQPRSAVSTIPRFLLVLAWVASFVVAYWMMSHGPGISPDSIVYLHSAESILAGLGVVSDGQPVIHFPPVYPLLIAAAGLVARDPLSAARFVTASFFATEIALVAAAAFLGAGRRLGAAFIAVALFSVSASVVGIHAMAWSEPAFFAFSLSGMLVLAAFIAYPGRRLLVLASVAFGLAMTTRYVGLSLFAPLLAAVVLLGRRTPRQRLTDACLALGAAGAPLGLWLLRNARVAYSATDASLVWHPIDGSHLRALVQTVSDYFFPLAIPDAAKAGIFVAGVLLLALGYRAMMRQRDERRPEGDLARSLAAVLLIFAAGYVAFLLLSISVAFAIIPLDDRLLYPLFGVLVVAAVVVAYQAHGPRWLRGILGLAAVLSIGLRAGSAGATVVGIHRHGSGYVTDAWTESATVAVIKKLPRVVAVFSNAPEAIGYLTGRTAFAVPDSVIRETLRPNTDYREELERFCRRASAGRAVAAYLTTDGIGDPVVQAYMARACVFKHAALYSDGTIYSVVPLP